MVFFSSFLLRMGVLLVVFFLSSTRCHFCGGLKRQRARCSGTRRADQGALFLSLLVVMASSLLRMDFSLFVFISLKLADWGFFVSFHFQVLQDDELRDSALLVFANKQDLPNAMNTAEVQREPLR